MGARVSLQILRVNRSSNKMLRRGISIALVGTDGSGKTTIAQDLENYLDSGLL